MASIMNGDRGQLGPIRQTNGAGYRRATESGSGGCKVVNGVSEDQEMLAEERDLADDAPWKRIQQNTFTRWVNEHLKKVEKNVNALDGDLSDGLLLIALIEVLSGKRMSRHNKRPSFRSQKLENVSVALKFLEHDERIKIVNIDSSHIVDCQLKLILGLIWTLILHYSISMPMWDGEEAAQESTPKQRLMNWVQSKLPGLPVKNFTSDWGDGKAIGALVDGVAPGLCPDWQDWAPEDALKNTTEAMTLADDWLSVPQLIRPEDMIDPNVDDLSMMTYLSQYPNAKLKPDAPLRPHTDPNRVKCYGQGLQPTGNVAGYPVDFTVDTELAGSGSVQCVLERPDRSMIPIDVTADGTTPSIYKCRYTPPSTGNYRVHVKFNGASISQSPFPVSVQGSVGDPAKVTVSGPGVELDGVVVGRQTYFNIHTKDAGLGSPDVAILCPDEKQLGPQSMTISEIQPGEYQCQYTTKQTGLHSVNVFFAGKQIPNSPFGANVRPVSDARKVRVLGRGIQSRGIRCGECATMRLLTRGAGEGEPSVQVIGPGGSKLPVKLVKSQEDTYDVSYEPVKEGRHVVMVTYGGDEVPNSPFEVNVAPDKECGIRCFGAGLSDGQVGKPAVFTVDTNGETGALGFNIAGMSRADIDCQDNGDGSARVTYTVTLPGEYAVHVLCDGEDVPGSPWMAQIVPADDGFDPEKVKVYGEGVEKNGVVEQKPTEFTIETKDAGDAPLSVQVSDSCLHSLPVQVCCVGDNVFTAQYNTQTAGKHYVQVKYGGMEVPGSPFRVLAARAVCLSAERVHVSTPLDRGSDIIALTPCSIEIDTREAGPDVDALEVVVTNVLTGDLVPVTLRRKSEGTFVAECVFPTAGTYSVDVSYGGQTVPQSPLTLDVQPSVDISKFKVDGLDSDVFAKSPAEIRVDTSALPADQRQGQVKGIIQDSRGNRYVAIKEDVKDNLHVLSFTPSEPGVYKVDLFYNEQRLTENSRLVTCVEGNDPSRVRAYGEGLRQALVNKANTFMVNTRGAGTGGLGLSVEGPSQAVINCEDNRNGTCLVQYTPTAPGEYDVFVKFAGENIPDSPFKVRAYADGDASCVRAFGPALEPGRCRAGSVQKFTVDATKAAPGPIGVQVTCDQGDLMQMPSVRDNEDGTYEVTFAAPTCATHCQIEVKHAGDHIPGSPFSAAVKPVSESDRVVVSGPGVSRDVLASLPTSFTIDAREAGDGELQAQISDPSGAVYQLPLSENADGTATAQYTPTDCGTYELEVQYDRTPVLGSPFPVHVQPTGEASKCRIKQGDLQSKVISPGEQQRIEVDAQEAGHGKVTCTVKPVAEKPVSSKQENIDTCVQEVRPGVFHAVYTPRNTADHSVEIKFGGQPVPDGFYTVKCTSVSERVSERVSRQSFSQSHRSVVEERVCEQSNRPLQFAAIPLPDSLGKLTAEVKQPSGDTVPADICDNKNGTATVTFQPTQHGRHQLSVKHNKQHVPDSPFYFVVEPPAAGVVTAEGPGLVEGVSGELANFTVITRNADAGGLSLAVEGPSKAEISCHDNEDGTMSVSYLPTSPGQYMVSVQFRGEHIDGSPFSVKITDGGRHRNQVSMSGPSEMALPGQITATDIQALTAKIRTPSGLIEPCFLKCLSNDHLGVSFTPREVGEHQVYVQRGDAEIAGSPFSVMVSARQVGDASKVRVSGEALHRAHTHYDNQVCIDTREAGFGGLSMSVEGPSKAEIKCDDRQDGKLFVSYHPKEPGQYKLNLKFADHHVQGSPFLVEVIGEGASRLREHVMCERRAPEPSLVGSQCALAFKMADVGASDLSASVMAPSGAIQPARVCRAPSDPGSYTVEFRAEELGVHTVSVLHRGAQIPGSPFQFTVGPLTEGGASHVRASGPGLERAKQNVLNEFDIWAREAGAGTLLISAEGPSKAEIDFRERDDGSCYVGYLVTEPGEYSIGVKFNEENIPGSPFSVYVAPNDADAANVVVKNLPAQVAEVNQPMTFSVSTAGVGGSRGQLECRLVGPDGSVDDCYLQREPGLYVARCVPRQLGTHHVHVTWNGMHVPGSPFRVRVGSSGGARHCQVWAHGAGLTRGQVGSVAQFVVDTCSAEPGTLAVTVDGPSKVELNCTEIAEGFLVGYTPLCRGVYSVGVKYNEEHINDSPFNATITGGEAENGRYLGHQHARMVVQSAGQVGDLGQGQVTTMSALPVATNSDCSRVVCEGEGLSRPRLGSNSFFVDTSEAGVDVLWVGCYGAGGSLCRPCDHVSLQHVKSGRYRVQYHVSTRGTYVLLVRWGEQHVPGSPFQISV